MFTGIIEEKGIVTAIKRGIVSSVLAIRGCLVFEDLKPGDSVAVNGVCLTAARVDANEFHADVMSETLKRSTLGTLLLGSAVNLERALPACGRLGGHIVSGHIDGKGRITKMVRDGNAVNLKIEVPEGLARYIVEKGSIAIDGISLTVTEISQTSFGVSVIPHTASETIFSDYRNGSEVNIEVDVLSKYVEKLLGSQRGVTWDLLTRNGFV